MYTPRFCASTSADSSRPSSSRAAPVRGVNTWVTMSPASSIASAWVVTSEGVGVWFLGADVADVHHQPDASFPRGLLGCFHVLQSQILHRPRSDDDLHALDQVWIVAGNLHHAFHVHLLLGGRRAQAAVPKDAQEGIDGGLRLGEDVIAEVLEVGGAGAARVGNGGDAGANAGHVGVVPVSAGMVYVGVNVHQAGGDNLAGNVQNFARPPTAECPAPFAQSCRP